MSSNHGKQLVLHGAIILLIGLCLGIPFGKAIVEGNGPDAERAWRGAHGGLIVTALILFAVACARLKFPGKTAGWAAWALIASGYGFTVGLPLAAYAGVRGLVFEGPLANQVVWVANRVGAFGALIGGVLVLWAAIAAARSGD